jgi:putative transposase
MSRAKTHSFMSEFEVQTTSKDRRVLRSRLEAGRQLYNAVLGEAIRRLARMRWDPDFEQAKAMPKGAARKAAFAALRVKHGFREYDLNAHPSLAEEVGAA